MVVLLKHCYRTLFLLIFLVLFSGVYMPSRQSPDITVTPLLENDSLMCEISCPALIIGDVRQTLLSGLPVLLEFIPEITVGETATRRLPSFKYRLTYDIWEDRYRVEGKAQEKFFNSLEALQDHWAPLKDLFLISAGQFAAEDKIVLDIRLKVTLLTRNQGEKLKDWISNAHETEENRPTLDRDTGFKLNLNRFISLFFNKSDVDENYQSRTQSPAFTLTGLQKDQ